MGVTTGIAKRELEYALKEMKNRKAVGPHEILTDAQKALVEEECNYCGIRWGRFLSKN